MFNWYNQNAAKNTITRYLSTKYTLEELNQLTHLELPEQFESVDYANELALILKDSPWKIKEVKYKTSSLKSLKGVFTKEYWFGKKNAYATTMESEEETSSIKDLSESVYFDAENQSETNSVFSQESDGENNWKDLHFTFTPELQNNWENQGFTYHQTKEWIDIGLDPLDWNFCAWLVRKGSWLVEKDSTPLALLNNGDLNQLRNAYQAYLTNPQPNNWWPRNQDWVLLGGLVLLGVIILTKD